MLGCKNDMLGCKNDMLRCKNDILERQTGLEPATFGLGSQRSTN